MTAFNFQPAPPLSEIVRMVDPCLVHITASDGSGSGFVIDERGHIITNAHVVKEKGVNVKVEFVDGSEIPGIVVGIDEEVDLACVLVLETVAAPPRIFTHISMGDSDSVSVGEDVLALGYPLGEILKGSPTVTRGIISAKRLGELQTDAAINPGNSGGPLINAYGNVIGVNTYSIVHVHGENITGVNFAISIDVVKEKLDFLALGGEVRKEADSDPDAFIEQEWTTPLVEWDTYGSRKYGWSISVAPGWHVREPEDYDDTSITLWAPNDRGAYLSVYICDLDDYESVEELCRQQLAAFLSRAEALESFELISAHEDDLGEHTWYRFNLRYQGAQDTESSFRMVQVGRVGLLEYVISADSFETDLPYCMSDIHEMVASFQF